MDNVLKAAEKWMEENNFNRCKKETTAYYSSEKQKMIDYTTVIIEYWIREFHQKGYEKIELLPNGTYYHSVSGDDGEVKNYEIKDGVLILH